jgi:hypothetical protein
MIVRPLSGPGRYVLIGEEQGAFRGPAVTSQADDENRT